MMKKTYMIPSIKVVEIKHKVSLMAGSIKGTKLGSSKFLDIDEGEGDDPEFAD